MTVHKAEAERLISPLSDAERNAVAVDAESRDIVKLGLMRAQVHATLHLAEQQRIANVIAFTEATGGMWSTLRATLNEELGL